MEFQVFIPAELLAYIYNAQQYKYTLCWHGFISDYVIHCMIAHAYIIPASCAIA